MISLSLSLSLFFYVSGGGGWRKRILKEIWCTRNVRFVNINFRKYLIFVFINIIIFITVTNAHNYSLHMDEFLV